MNPFELPFLAEVIAMCERETAERYACTRKPCAVAVYGETQPGQNLQVCLVDVSYRADEPWRVLWEVTVRRSGALIGPSMLVRLAPRKEIDE